MTNTNNPGDDMPTFRKTQAQINPIADSLWTRKEAMLCSFAQANAQNDPPPTRIEREALAQINRELDSCGAPRARPEGA